ncbi:MAG: hypothetical protein R3C97_18100 [Geminicoccaceae bacterium]
MRKAHEQASLLDGGHARPGTVLESTPRRGNGFIDFHRSAGRETGEHLAVARTTHVDPFAGRRFAPFAVDEEKFVHWIISCDLPSLDPPECGFARIAGVHPA